MELPVHLLDAALTRVHAAQWQLQASEQRAAEAEARAAALAAAAAAAAGATPPPPCRGAAAQGPASWSPRADRLRGPAAPLDPARGDATGLVGALSAAAARYAAGGGEDDGEARRQARAALELMLAQGEALERLRGEARRLRALLLAGTPRAGAETTALLRELEQQHRLSGEAAARAAAGVSRGELCAAMAACGLPDLTAAEVLQQLDGPAHPSGGSLSADNWSSAAPLLSAPENPMQLMRSVKSARRSL
eukprot:TRINITY_DN13843_c0_g1_i1.p1 TRINITY_DN13843_c0_g1~~TRINITY_DN13843_c0_g1_i1.p1  ORF type:complete len:271 (+),score=107.27 TRINITY_DN13843_c0_g1_i1:64-813(+)